MYRPLADIIRPQKLDDIVGQRHLLGEKGILRRIIESGVIPNMVFYGPSGTGKTTVANIIANETSRRLYRLNATTASISDIRDIISDLGTMFTPQGVLLYLDEIQYFNKKQQQSLLEFIENGAITLIASTTENPYFYVFNAILSRATVFEFKPLEPDDVARAAERAVMLGASELGLSAEIEPGAADHIARACGGDVRKAVNAVELLLSSGAREGGAVKLTLEDARIVSQRSSMRYDRDGDAHYDILSAFQKSIRGSDPDAALHYLARLLSAGDLASASRRLLVTASEDIGLAYPQAIAIVKACVDAAFQLGLPEAQIPLGQAVILCATAPKSNSAVTGISSAAADVAAGGCGDVPDHLKDSHYKGAKSLGRGKSYLYPHDFDDAYVQQQYLPDALLGRVYYNYGENKAEQAAKRYWDAIKGTSEASDK